VIALALEIIIATTIAGAVWNSGHRIGAVIIWFVIMGFRNSLQ
jgi:hypothetical protein